jgi:hypothetical protein
MLRGVVLICVLAAAVAAGCGGGGSGGASTAEDCRELAGPEDGQIVLDRVGFIGYPPAGERPGRELQSDRWGDRRFAKLAVQVRGGGPVHFSVPASGRGSVELRGWDGDVEPARRLLVEAPVTGDCSDFAWTAHPGGFLFDRPVCLRLRVESEGRSASVPFGLGRDCPAIGSDET